MHELGVSQQILTIATEHARQAGAKRITDLYLVIGDLSSFVDESIQFYWDMLAKGTLAEGATLHFKRVPATFHCHDCDQDYQPERGQLFCPLCDGQNVTVTGGEEFRLEAIDVE